MLLDMEGWDSYSTTSQKWDFVSGIGNGIQSSGRNGKGQEFFSFNQNIGKTIPGGAKQTLIVGTAYKLASYHPSASWSIINLFDGGTTQVDLRCDTSGNLTVTRNGTTILSGLGTISTGVWMYLELKVKIDNSTGTVEVYKNGVSLGSASSLDTQNTGNATADRVYIGGATIGSGGSTIFSYYDDIYICDSSGSTNNTFLGDVKVECLMPSGNGNSSTMVGSDGNSTDNYLLVDEIPPNDDTDYVVGTSVGDKDTYAYGNLATTTGTILGVKIGLRARKADAGSRSICSVARLSSTEVDSSNISLGDSYAYFSDIRETKPGGGAWTITDVNAAEFGAKVTV